MRSGYFVALSITFPTAEAKAAWLAAPLLPHARALEDARVSLEDSSFFEGRPKKVAAKALVAFVKKSAKEGEHYLALRDAKTKLTLTGYLDGYGDYQLFQPPVFLAVASARAEGASARALFFRDADQNDGPVYDALVGDASGLIASREHEPQDLTEAAVTALVARFEADLAAIERARDVWLEKFTEKKLRRERAGMTGIVRGDGSFVIAPAQLRVGFFSSGVVPVKDRTHEWSYADTDGNTVAKFSCFEALSLTDGLGLVRLFDGSYRFQAPDGRTVISERRGYVEVFAGGRAVFGDVHENGVAKPERGYLDETGAVVAPPIYAYAQAFACGRGLVCVGDRYAGGKWGWLDASGAAVIPPRYESAGTFVEKLAPVLVANEWGLVDTSGALVLTPRFAQAAYAEAGLVIGKLETGWGVLTSSGDVVIAPEHTGGIVRRGALFEARQAGGSTCALFDLAGARAVGSFAQAHGHVVDGRLAVRTESGLWGYVDERGAMAIAPKYQAAFQFGCGHAIVVDGSTAIVIDTSGARVATLALATFGLSASGFGPSGLAIVGSHARYGLAAIDGRMVLPPHLVDAAELGAGFVRVTYASAD